MIYDQQPGMKDQNARPYVVNAIGVRKDRQATGESCDRGTSFNNQINRRQDRAGNPYERHGLPLCCWGDFHAKA